MEPQAAFGEALAQEFFIAGRDQTLAALDVVLDAEGRGSRLGPK